MTVEQVPMYRVVCDGCGVSASDGTDYYAWAELEGAENDAEGAGFAHINDGDYCEDCWEHDCDDVPRVKVKASGGESMTTEGNEP